MNKPKYKGILYFITAVILATLCIQVYWNYKNYQIGKQQLINDVQTSLDNSVDIYYTDLAKNESFRQWQDSTFFRTETHLKNMPIFSDSLGNHRQLDIKLTSQPNRVSMIQSIENDSGKINITLTDSLTRIGESKMLAIIDSIADPIDQLSSKIIVSFREDTLSLKRIDSILLTELNRKNINIDYGMSYEGVMGITEKLRPESIESAQLSTSSLSPYSLRNSIISVHFSNVTMAVLKKNLVGILLSLLLVSGVILCLLYLLKIIKHQKQLSELKNDLINNITHEFKTPIATIGVAMEAIQEFNTVQDTEKNLRYAKISQEQVEKLNGMVEKLLETATLDSENLQLKFESTDLVGLLEKATIKEIYVASEKNISFRTSEENMIHPVDVFHFENALNNIIDNAIKYGGDEITVSITKTGNAIEIDICDDGNELTEDHKKHIFEKFYRVPKGNMHDVKGFGIGLYYAKKIIEKHQGTLSLQLDKETTFKIVLPYAREN